MSQSPEDPMKSSLVDGGILLYMNQETRILATARTKKQRDIESKMDGPPQKMGFSFSSTDIFREWPSCSFAGA